LNQASSTSVSSSANPSIYGQSVTFTAAVSSASGTPTGTVKFLNRSASMGTAKLTGGTATLTTTAATFQQAGTKPITAVYGGSTSAAGSTSAVLNQVVNPASP
jgi:hypothetical protein